MNCVRYLDISRLNFDVDKMKDFCPSRRDYVLSIKDIKRQKQSLYVWYLLLITLKEEGYKTENLKWSIDKNGKWFVENKSINFSLTHSNNIVAIIISDEGEVAIDVELCDEKVLAVAKLFNKPIDDLSIKDRIKYATEQWTRKECLIKNQSVVNFKTSTVLGLDNFEYILTFGVSNKHSVEKYNICKVNI